MTFDSRLLGNRIRQARERLGLSQEDLATAISKDQRAISEYEHGRRRIAAADLPILAQSLQVPLLYFYEGEASVYDLDRAMLDEFHQIATPDAQRAAIEIVRLFSTYAGTHKSS